MLGCKWEPLFGGSHFLCTFFIACVPDRTLSDLPLPHPADRFSSHLESHLPEPAGDGCRRRGRSPEFSATRLWHRLAAEPPGFQFPLESAVPPRPCRCSAASTVGFCVALFVAPREKTFQRACVTVDRTVGQPFLSHLKNHVVKDCRIEAIDGEGHIQSFRNCVKMLFVSC